MGSINPWKGLLGRFVFPIVKSREGEQLKVSPAPSRGVSTLTPHPPLPPAGEGGPRFYYF